MRFTSIQKFYRRKQKKEKLLEDENVEIIDINVDDDLDKAVEEIIKKVKELDKDDE